MRIGTLLLGAMGLLGGHTVQAGVVQTPWNLAVVLESSDQVNWQLQGESGLKRLNQALALALRGLPLRITAGLWLAEADGGRMLLHPAPAARLKGSSLRLGPGRGEADLDGGLAMAAQWLLNRGGGSLLLIAATGPRNWNPPQPGPAGQMALYCHVLSLSSPRASGGLRELAVKGGGTQRSLERLTSLSTLLNQAVLSAISPARLNLITHDEQNQSRQVRVGLAYQGNKLPPQTVLSNRPVQLPEGNYELAWPKQHSLGPGPLLKRASLKRIGLTEVYAGGTGEIKVTARQFDGSELNWRLSVARVADGRQVVAHRPAPFEAKMPAGRYLVSSVSPAQSWNVLLKPGATLEVWAGPRASLKVVLPGPARDLQVRYWLTSLLSQRGEVAGYTGNQVALLPGPYRLEIAVPPGLSRELELRPGQKLELNLEPVGELLVTLRGKGKRTRFQVLDPAGKVLATGISGKALPLLPGAYRLQPLEGGNGLDFAIKSGQRTDVALDIMS
jgi:hypothetical protein